MCRPRGVLVDDQRAHLGDAAAERRQLGAADDDAVALGDEEPGRAAGDILERARQQVPGLEVVHDQLVNGAPRRAALPV